MKDKAAAADPADAEEAGDDIDIGLHHAASHRLDPVAELSRDPLHHALS